MSSKAYFVKSTNGSIFPLSYQELPSNAGSLGTDGDGNIVAGSGLPSMPVNSILGTTSTGTIINVLSGLYNEHRHFNTWDHTLSSPSNVFSTILLTYDDAVQVYYGGTGDGEYKTNPEYRSYKDVTSKYNMSYLDSNRYNPCVTIANSMTLGGVFNIEGSQPGVDKNGGIDLFNASGSNPSSKYMPRIKMFNNSIIWTSVPDSTSCQSSSYGNYTVFFGSNPTLNTNDVMTSTGNTNVNILSEKKLILSYGKYEPENSLPGIYLSATTNNFVSVENTYGLNVDKSTQYFFVHSQGTGSNTLTNIYSTNINLGDSSTNAVILTGTNASITNTNISIGSLGISNITMSGSVVKSIQSSTLATVTISSVPSEYYLLTYAGSITVTLPAPVVGRSIVLMKNSATTGTVTANAGTGNTIKTGNSGTSAQTYVATTNLYVVIRLIGISATEWMVI